MTNDNRVLLRIVAAAHGRRFVADGRPKPGRFDLQLLDQRRSFGIAPASLAAGQRAASVEVLVLVVGLGVDASDEEIGRESHRRPDLLSMDGAPEEEVGRRPLLGEAEHGENSVGVAEAIVGRRLDDGRFGDAESAGQPAERLHHVLVRIVVARVHDPDAFRPVGPVSRPQNVQRGPALVPGHGRPRLDRHLSVVRVAAVLQEQLDGPPYQGVPSGAGSHLSVVIGEQGALVFHPGPPGAHLSLPDGRN